jgi:N-acetylneuraminate synthase
MDTDRDLSPYVVYAEESISSALKKLNENRARIVFSLTERGILEGVLTDGDLRRWIMRQESVDPSAPVSRITNKHFTFAYHDDPPEKISLLFSDRTVQIPLIDEFGRLVAVATSYAQPVRIGRFEISADKPVFIVAEIGINHNGSVDLAKRLVDQAVDSGADCAKFQLRNVQALYRNQGINDVKEDLGAQYVLDLVSRFSLSAAQMFSVFDHCRERGILPLCTPWDVESVQALAEYGVEAYKVASADLTNQPLLRAIAATRKPAIISTGMSTEAEIAEAVVLLRRLNVRHVLLHCNSTYPAPFKDVNLRYIDRLRELSGGPVGYSGHERGWHVAAAAVARGAKIIEKHFTLDRSMEGNDHKVSLLPDEFRAMVDAIRDIESALGSADVRRVSPGEAMNREALAKSLVVARDLVAGDLITREYIAIKSPGRGLQPNRMEQLVGRKAQRSMKAGDFFFESDLVDKRVEARAYSFARPWGIPVRFHDYRELAAKSNMDFLEFHLSYKDLEEDLSLHFSDKLDLDFTVHSPDLYRGDHILNLASKDRKVRERSIGELQRVVDLTLSIARFFKPNRRPLVIASLGGFTKERHIDPTEKRALYELVADSLSRIVVDDVEIVAQTLPPFPWYIGGQLFCNLFVDPVDTAKFCGDFNMRLCFDTSHSRLATNFLKISFKDFIDTVAPHIAHLHIVDAKGVDGEGVQIGEGEIDFAAMAEQLSRLAPAASFIPEIWQGHKNYGEGFWIACERLEKWFSPGARLAASVDVTALGA